MKNRAIRKTARYAARTYRLIHINWYSKTRIIPPDSLPRVTVEIGAKGWRKNKFLEARVMEDDVSYKVYRWGGKR